MKSTHSITLLLALIVYFIVSPFVYEQRALGAVMRLVLFTALLGGMVYGMSYSRRVSSSRGFRSCSTSASSP